MNMSYCKFENTYRAIVQCVNELEEEGGLQEFLNEASESEFHYANLLIKMCGEIVESYGDELNGV